MVAGCAAPAVEMKANPTTAYMDARTVLLRDADDKDPVVRCNAMESLASAEDAAATGAMMQGLKDGSPAVQFAAAMSLGDCSYAAARQQLLTMAQNPATDRSVQCAVLYALHRIGDDSHTGQLGRLLFDDSPDVRANAALAMGKLGDESAIRPLKSLVAEEHDLKVRLQVRESLTALGDDSSLTFLRARARAGVPEEQMMVIQALGRTKNEQVRGILLWALRPEHEPMLRVAAAIALARTGDMRGYDLILSSARDPRMPVQLFFHKGPEDQVMQRYIVQLQSLSALGLGVMDKKPAVDDLLPLLQSPEGTVRVAAARSVLQLLNSYRAFVGAAASPALASLPAVAAGTAASPLTAQQPSPAPASQPASRPAQDGILRDPVLNTAPALD